MALFDWTSEKQANVYTAAANKKRMAMETAKRIVGDHMQNEDCPTFLPYR